MHFDFFKYHGTGNDFVLIDDRAKHFPDDNFTLIANICARHLGVGADGLILLREDKGVFEMCYFNSDGFKSSMCGNGGRCFVQFLSDLQLIDNHCHFKAPDGMHFASLESGLVKLEMSDVKEVKRIDSNSFVLNTGSPHYVRFFDAPCVQDNFISQARQIRNAKPFAKEGINVNFAWLENNEIHLRTYERGVEDETLSCGTGMVAVGILSEWMGFGSKDLVKINSKAGFTSVGFKKQAEGNYKEIFLMGPAVFVFQGIIDSDNGIFAA